MRDAEITEYVEGLGDVVSPRPAPGDGTPEIAWGDTFVRYSPDGSVPQGQPVATVVTKDHPDDERSRLDRDGAFRVTVAAGRELFEPVLGHRPGEPLASDAAGRGRRAAPPPRLRRAGGGRGHGLMHRLLDGAAALRGAAALGHAQASPVTNRAETSGAGGATASTFMHPGESVDRAGCGGRS